MVQLDSNRIRTPQGRRIGNPELLGHQYITIYESADLYPQLRGYIQPNTKNGYVIVG